MRKQKREKSPQSIQVNQFHKVAQYANPRQAAPTKRERKLKGRVDDFKRGPTADNRDRQGRRWDAGGYHCPGSLSK